MDSDHWEVFELTGLTAKNFGHGWVYGDKSSTTWSWSPASGPYGLFKTRRMAERGLAQHRRREFWRAMWRKALKNMPQRLRIHRTESWVVVRVPMPAPEFIRGNAAGVFEIRNGKIYRHHVEESEVFFGGQQVLARIFYPNNKDGHNTVFNMMTEGYAPKGSARQALLLKLAEEGGRELALQKLKEMGRRTDWYVK